MLAYEQGMPCTKLVVPSMGSTIHTLRERQQEQQEQQRYSHAGLTTGTHDLCSGKQHHSDRSKHTHTHTYTYTPTSVNRATEAHNEKSRAHGEKTNNTQTAIPPHT